MHYIIALYDAPSDPDHFRSYYVDTHLKLAAELPGLRAMQHSFDVQSIAGPSYFCTWTGVFADAAAADAALASPEGAALAADIPNYVTAPMQLFRYSAEEFAG